MEAHDGTSGISLTSVVNSTVIGESYTLLEQYTEEGIFVGSLLIREDKIVRVQYNADYTVAKRWTIMTYFFFAAAYCILLAVKSAFAETPSNLPGLFLGGSFFAKFMENTFTTIY